MKAMDDPSVITLERLAQTMKELEMAQMDREMEILLSDSGPAALILMHGGQLVEVNGKLYAVANSLPKWCWPGPPPKRFNL